MTDEQIKHMVNRFLGWRLPENFNPDAGISFKAEYNAEYNSARGMPPARHEPNGTNLFDATQAEAMVRYMVEGLDFADDILTRCASGSFRIVCTGDLTEFQIAEARAEGRMYVDLNGFGYVLLPWNLTTTKDKEREKALSING